MRIAIISDIHANLAALESVLEDIDGEQISQILGLGDNIGYGPDPEEVIVKLKERGMISIQGNHEYAILNRAYFNRMNPDPKKSLEMTLKMISPETLTISLALSRSWCCTAIPAWSTAVRQNRRPATFFIPA